MRMFPPQRQHHPTTHNEIQWPTAARQCYFVLRDVSCKQSWHLWAPSHPQVSPEWPYCQQAQCKQWFTIYLVKHSRPPQMSPFHLLGLQARIRPQLTCNGRHMRCISHTYKNWKILDHLGPIFGSCTHRMNFFGTKYFYELLLCLS